MADPVPKNMAWVVNPIDAFVLARLEENKLTPASPASRVALLRRTYFDLTGLPPSPEEIEMFTKATRSGAHADLIERLLASPQYGERWARHWLDVVRYADTGGFEHDLSYRNAWRYRDYVIRSFNANKPFDRFIQEQVAGDELWPDDADALAATGLYAVGPVSQDSAMMSTQLEYEWLTDTADTTGAAFLGLTFGCARCHDHKYDPLTQRDYFGLQAIFAASDRPYPDAVREHRIKGLNGILADVPIPKELKDDPRCTIKTDDKIGAQLFHREMPLEIHRLRRGELSKPLEVIAPALPAVFAVDKKLFDPAAAPAGQRRAVFAKWLVSPNNSLTARVIVNRVWAWHFGQGLVRTPGDFGAQGEQPTHRELLDWLTRDFAGHGWDLKRLHRLILSSATYQMQSAGVSARAQKLDPENRLLSHFPRRRLDAEAVWDSLHACAGTLNLKPFGPPVVPMLTKEELSGLFGSTEKWKVTKDPAEFTRRGIYLFERRTFLFPMFDAFDPPDVMTSCARRFETTVPTQALALLNSEAAQGQAREFARRLLKECGEQPEKIPARAWLLAFNRPITQSESDRAQSFLRARRNLSREDALAELCLSLFNANEFVFID
ncbi:MAG: DUF1553 domain-containing protein [Verrucomicrobia bacterium]|nr:DUF1553 domain-containing protein [Verrucomicrobiota bacterium]